MFYPILFSPVRLGLGVLHGKTGIPKALGGWVENNKKCKTLEPSLLNGHFTILQPLVPLRCEVFHGRISRSPNHHHPSLSSWEDGVCHLRMLCYFDMHQDNHTASGLMLLSVMKVYAPTALVSHQRKYIVQQ